MSPIFLSLESLWSFSNLNVARKRDRKNDENGLDGHDPRIPQMLPGQIVGVV